MKVSLVLVMVSPVASVLRPGVALRNLHISAVQEATIAHRVSAEPWQNTAFYIMLVVLVLAMIGLLVKCVKGPPAPSTIEAVAAAKVELAMQENELNAAMKAIRAGMKSEDVEAGLGPEVDEDAPPIDYEACLRTAAQAVAQTVGPKIAKGQAVKNILETRVRTLQNQTKSFVIDELHGTAGEVLAELGAEEAMLLLDPSRAVQGNFPPLPVLLAGLFSPVVLGLTALNHVAQALIHFLPIVILCSLSVYIDAGHECFIPTIFYWLYAHLAVGGLLLLCHLCQVIKVVASKSTLTSDMQARGEKIKMLAEQCKHGDVKQIRQMFIETCVMIQKALEQEDNVRRSCFAKLIGFFTFIWIGMTIWTFVLVLGWTMVPGTIAFHHSAKEAAGDEYCGAWFTVLTARLCCFIGVIFLIVNLGTVSQWFADSAKFNPVFANLVISEAKKIDDQAGGIPVVQILVKAFVLRGSSETLELQMSSAEMEKSKRQSEVTSVQRELDAVISQLTRVDSEHVCLTTEVEKMPGRSFVAIKPAKSRDLQVEDAGSNVGQRANEIAGAAGAALSDASQGALEQYETLQAQADKLRNIAESSVGGLSDEMKKQLESTDLEATKQKALALAQQTQEELWEMIKAIMQKMQEIQESDAYKKACRDVEEALKAAAEMAAERAKLLTDSELGRAIAAGDTEALKKMGYDSVEVAHKKAQEMAAEAMKVAAEMEASPLGQAIKTGDKEALKKLGYESAEMAQKEAEKLVEQGKQAVTQAKQLVDSTELGKALTSGDTEALKKLGYENLDAAKAKAQELVEEGKKVAEEARRQLEDTELGKAIASGNVEDLKKLGFENLEVAQLEAKKFIEQGQKAAAEARQAMDDTELGRALAAGDTEALRKMGCESIQDAKKMADEAVKKGQDAAAKARKDIENAIESNDTDTLKKYGLDGIDHARNQLEVAVNEAASKAAQNVASVQK